MGRLDGKVVVILGASDERSMGAATARRFAKEGAKLVLAARRLDALEPIAAGVKGIAVACDITKEADLERLARTAVDKFGKLDVAINYAGVNMAAPLSEVTREALMQSCEVHLVGTALFFKHMGAKLSDGGAMITTSSLTALTAPPGLAAYAAAKRGVDQMVRIAAIETTREDCVRHSLVNRLRWSIENIGKHCLAGHGQPIEEVDLRIGSQQRLNFTTQRVVVTSRGGENGVALFGRPFHDGLKYHFHALPSLTGHD